LKLAINLEKAIINDKVAQFPEAFELVYNEKEIAIFSLPTVDQKTVLTSSIKKCIQKFFEPKKHPPSPVPPPRPTPQLMITQSALFINRRKKLEEEC